jgi:hypothetical protein
MQETAQIILKILYLASLKGVYFRCRAMRRCGSSPHAEIMGTCTKMMIRTQYFLESKGFDILHEWDILRKLFVLLTRSGDWAAPFCL